LKRTNKQPKQPTSKQQNNEQTTTGTIATTHLPSLDIPCKKEIKEM